MVGPTGVCAGSPSTEPALSPPLQVSPGQSGADSLHAAQRPPVCSPHQCPWLMQLLEEGR